MNRLRTITVAASRFLLGTFILWQLVFLAAATGTNLEKSLGKYYGLQWPRWPSEALHDFRENAFLEYGQLTGQAQDHWSLFAPDLSDEFAFLQVELRWDDNGLPPGCVTVHPLEPVFLRSRNEPENLQAFLRTGGFRFRRYETHITPAAVPREVLFGQAELAGTWQPAILEYEQADSLVAYMNWRVTEFRRQHPERTPPSQVFLWIHAYRIPAPPGPQPWNWDDLGPYYIGRWLPGGVHSVALDRKER
jgi:hypothetical protein